MRFPHRAQQYAGKPRLVICIGFWSAVIPLPLPSLANARRFRSELKCSSPYQNSLDFIRRFRLRKKIKKKKVKVYRRENVLTISSPAGFFAKNICAEKDALIFFAKKYCIAFSLQKGRALSFFSFFLLKNFRSNIGFKTQRFFKTKSLVARF